MNIPFLSLFLLLAALSHGESLIARAEPPWAANPEAFYNPALYEIALGLGSSWEEAEKDAHGALSRRFGTRVTSRMSLETSYPGEARLKKTVGLSAGHTLFHVRIAQRARVGDTFYALALMDKQRASALLEQKIKQNSQRLAEWASRARWQDEALFAHGLLGRALSLAEENEAMNNQLQALNPQKTFTLPEDSSLLRQQLRGIKLSISLELLSAFLHSPVGPGLSGFEISTGAGYWLKDRLSYTLRRRGPLTIADYRLAIDLFSTKGGLLHSFLFVGQTSAAELSGLPRKLRLQLENDVRKGWPEQLRAYLAEN